MPRTAKRVGKVEVRKVISVTGKSVILLNESTGKASKFPRGRVVRIELERPAVATVHWAEHAEQPAFPVKPKPINGWPK